MIDPLARDNGPAVDGRAPAMLEGTVHDRYDGRLRVLLPDVDGGTEARTAFGDYPNAVEGDAVRVQRNELGFTIVAWQAA